MKIKNLKLINFKKISSNNLIEFNEDINVLVWSNNAGKTSVLQALAVAFNLPVQDFNQNDSIYYLLKDWVCEIQSDFLFNQREWEIAFSQIKHSHQNKDFTSLTEKIKNKTIQKKKVLNFVDSRLKWNTWEIKILDQEDLTQEEKSLTQQALNKINHQDFYQFFWAPLFIDSKRSILPIERFAWFTQTRSQPVWTSIWSKLFLIKSENKELFESIKKHILSIFKEIKDFNVVQDLENNSIKLEITENLRKNWSYQDIDYDIKNTGLWMQSLILIIANIFLMDSKIVLMDEPEVHMHPNLVKKFIKIIQEISKDKQIILTSHSIPLINSIPYDKIFSLKYLAEEKWVIVNSIKEEKWVIETLKDIGFDVENEIFSYAQRSKKVVFVEWESDEDFLITFASKFKNELWIKDNFNFPIFEEMWGKWDSFKVADTIKKLKKAKEESDLSFLLTVDKDENENLWLKEKLEKDQLHIWNKRQIENYLIDAKSISKLTWKDESEIQNKIDELVESQKEDIFYKFFKELFFWWKVSKTSEIRDFLDENRWKLIEDFEWELQKIVLWNLIDSVQSTKKEAKNLQSSFDEVWSKNRLNLCDWKKVLKNLRRDFSLSFKDIEIIEEMQSCPDDIKDFWLKIIT